MSDILGTPPDTHCWDDDSGKDCWSYSPRLVAELLAAERERLNGVVQRQANLDLDTLEYLDGLVGPSVRAKQEPTA